MMKMKGLNGLKLKCGCVVDYYWCEKHEIYTGTAPPFGAGNSRSKESAEVLRQELPDDYKPEGCSCHISAPCGYCTQLEDQPPTP